MDFKTKPTYKAPLTSRFDATPPRIETPKPSAPHVAAPRTNIWAKVASMVFLLCLLVLVVSLLLILAFGKFNRQNSNFSVAQLVNASNRQIVTESSPAGPTYYVGNLTYLGQDYLVLENAQQVIYSKADNTSKVEALNCNSPLDGKKLVINRQSVLTWNNVDSSSLLNSATADTSCNNTSEKSQSESKTTNNNKTSTTNSTTTTNSADQSSQNDTTTDTVPVSTEPFELTN
jgi:hypothetical protein